VKTRSERAGFPGENVERALDWLADLAGERDRPPILDAIGSPAEQAAKPRARSLRVFTDAERARLSADSRGYLLTLERAGILSPQQREIVIDRLMALGHEELDLSQLKWIVLMVLSSQPGQELACSLMEDLVFDMPRSTH
jgi:Smg protein